MPCFIVFVFIVPRRVVFFYKLKANSPPAKDYNLLCCHTCFIAVVWNRKCNISEIFLHYEHFSTTEETILLF